MTNLTALEKAAREAVKVAPGEWVGGAPWPSDWVVAPNTKIGGHFHVADIRGWGYFTGHGDGGLGLPDDVALAHQGVLAKHVALANPSAILDLIQRVKEAEGALEPFAEIIDLAGDATGLERLRNARSMTSLAMFEAARLALSRRSGDTHRG